MKRLLTLALLIGLFSNCERKKSEKIKQEFEPETEITSIIESKPKSEININSKKEQDTVCNYWELILDTTKIK